MALARYESVAANLAGDVIPNATVEVREDRPGRPVVPLWADRNGTVPLGNPITTDFEGKFGFHVSGGSYYIRVFTGPSQQPLQQYVRRYQAIGTAAERDVEDLATALEAGTATFSTLADLVLFVPIAEGVGGKVTAGPDAGFYHYDDVAEEWVFARPLYDSLARMEVTGGTADAIEAETATGVADSAVVMLWIEAPGDNTGPVTINGKEVLTAGGNSLIAGQWNEGRTYWFSDEGASYKLRTESDVDGIATQVELWANETMANKNYAEEWAQSPDPISVDAGGDGVNDQSAKAWAEASEDSAALAAGYASGVNLPLISPGDAGKMLYVKVDESGYELDDTPLVTIVPGDGIAIDNTDPTAPVVSSTVSVRIRPQADRTYYVRTDGNDANTGLANTAGAAFLTIQRAIDWVAGQVDLNGFTVTVKVADGTYASAGQVKGPFTGQGTVKIEGNLATPSNVVIPYISAKYGAVVQVGGFRTTATLTPHLLVDNGHIVMYGGWDFASSGASHVEVASTGVISLQASYRITGGAVGGHLHTPNSGGYIICTSPVVTLVGTPHFGAYYAGTAGGKITVPSSVVAFSGAATGPRFYAHTNGVIDCGGESAGTFLPGNAGGVTQSGGRYIGYEGAFTAVLAAQLPTPANNVFNMYIVRDSVVTTIGSPVAGGGGAFVLVVSNGSAWKVQMAL